MLIGITGSTGSLGKRLILFLKKNKKNKIIEFNGDISKYTDVNNWLKKNKIDIIIHLAAIVPVSKVKKNPSLAKKVNFIGTKNLVCAIRKNIIKKIWFFYASTSHVYGYSNKKVTEKQKVKPINYYARTKLMSEKYLTKYKSYYNLCIGRIFSFTSYEQSNSYFIPNSLKMLRSVNKSVTFNNVDHYRDFLAIEDICSAINILLKKKATGIFNICSNENTSLIDIIKSLNYNSKKLIFKKSIKSTSLLGNNAKLRNLGWNIKYQNYLKYIKNYFLRK